MEEEKSRVVLYAKLRKKIDNMEVYSFSDTETTKKHLPVNNSTSVEMKDDSYKPKIKKNTLSLTIDELIKEHEQYNSKEQQKEIKRKYSASRKQNGKFDSSRSSRIIWASIIVIVVLGIATIIVLLLLSYYGKK